MGDRIDFNGFYRGICVDNYDPLVKGRLKIHIPGVYAEELSKVPENLPWAEPVMPLFGGNWTNERSGDLNVETGVSTIPHTSSKPLEGAQLWVFFEKGDQNYPKYFGAVQGGPGWLSEHNNQHVIKTDNVRVRIDENPGMGTCKFDSYNKNNNHLSKKKQISQMPTRTDIEIWNEGGNAVNIIIKGNVNMKVEGDIFEEHLGDKHITHTGNVYKKHIGDIYEEHQGALISDHAGDTNLIHKGAHSEIHTGDWKYTNTKGDILHDIKGGNYQFKLLGDFSSQIVGAKVLNVQGDKSEDVVGCVNCNYTGQYSVQAQEIKYIASEDLINISNTGNMIFQTFGFGPYDTKLPTYPASNLYRGGIIMHGAYIRETATGVNPTPNIPVVPFPYRYMPGIMLTPVNSWAIEKNTGNQIHNNKGIGHSNFPEYDIGWA
jgi:hypothetical protein